MKNLFPPGLPAIRSLSPEATAGSTSFLYILPGMVRVRTLYSHFLHIKDSMLYTLFCTLFFS